jgi:hypothetical protein
MKRIQWIIVTVPMVLLLLSPCLQAEFVAQQHEKIQGIGETGMMVVIEGLGTRERELGLSEDKIRADIERKLKTAEIKVVSHEGQKASLERYPYLYVNVNAAFVENVPYVVYNVSLEANREAVLIPEAVLDVTSAMVRKGFKTLCNKQDEESIKSAENICEREKNSPDEPSLKPLEGKISCYVTVWQENYTSMVATDKMKRKITAQINDLVDDFIQDYRKVNLEQFIKEQEAI